MSLAPKQRKRKSKNDPRATIPDGNLLIFSTHSLNEASAEVLKTKKKNSIVEYHQTHHGTTPQPLR